MTLIQIASVVVGVLMILTAFNLFSDKGGKKLLRDRVSATREIKSLQSDDDFALLETQSSKGLFLILAGMLGYQPGLPAKYAASPQIVGPLAAITGVIAFNLSGKFLPQIAALATGICLSLFSHAFYFDEKSKPTETSCSSKFQTRCP